MAYMKGIDVSKWQANKIDYVEAKKAGYDFVFIRIGYNTSKDAYFEGNYIKAKAAGMKIGIYFYTTQTSVEEAKNDANRVLTWLGSKTLDMPIAYDMEEASMKKISRKNLNSEQYNAFADIIKNRGFIPMLYTGASMFNSYFNKNMIEDNLWIAKYSINDGKNHGCPNVGKPIAIHQYTSAAVATDFYKEGLDRSQMMISYNELMKKPSLKPEADEKEYTHKEFIKELQKAIGASVDGEAGPETLSKTITLSKLLNRRHAAVKPIQKYLNSIGFNCGVADGVFGTKTYNAVKAFQKANGCVCDGVITAKNKTWKKLLKLQ